MKKILTYIGEDSHSLPVYRDTDGMLYKDTDPRAHVPAALYSVKGDNLEDDLGAVLLTAVKFVPKRKTW